MPDKLVSSLLIYIVYPIEHNTIIHNIKKSPDTHKPDLDRIRVHRLIQGSRRELAHIMLQVLAEYVLRKEQILELCSEITRLQDQNDLCAYKVRCVGRNFGAMLIRGESVKK